MCGISHHLPRKWSTCALITSWMCPSAASKHHVKLAQLCRRAFKQSCLTLLDSRQRNLRKFPNVQYFRNRELVAVFVLKSCSYSKWLMPKPFPATHPLPQSAPCEAQGPAQGRINSGKGGCEWDRYKGTGFWRNGGGRRLCPRALSLPPASVSLLV